MNGRSIISENEFKAYFFFLAANFIMVTVSVLNVYHLPEAFA